MKPEVAAERQNLILESKPDVSWLEQLWRLSFPRNRSTCTNRWEFLEKFKTGLKAQ
jgi:hypothetical protein